MAVFPALFGLLLASLVTGQSVRIEPARAVRRVGDELEVRCKVPYPIDSCRMTVGTTPYRLKPGNSDGDVIYYGEGLDKGECGAHIRNIREEWNGNISCVLPPETGSIELTATMQLMVARAPRGPRLISPPQSNFREGDVLAAQCVVAGGRPAAKISWFLDEEELLQGVHQPIVTPEPGAEDLQTISQNVSRTLSAADNGRTLVCRAEHEALPQPADDRLQLIVYYPPKVESRTLTIFGLQVNSEGRLNVSVRANPAPRAEWSVGDARLRAPQQTVDGTVTALQPLHLGAGYYNVTLVLAQIKKEDVERTAYLTVSNDLGAETIAVRVSTMEEPAARKANTSYLIIDVYGVELETGAIVGIVVGVLLVLVAVSLLVFAFATDRWCFAGGRRDTTKSSGESSDTESAAGGAAGGARARLAALGARVRAALPRRDKVQDAEPHPHPHPHPHHDKPADEKVVYATLALSEGAPAHNSPAAAAAAPPPAFAEYAEILYTDHGHKEPKQSA